MTVTADYNTKTGQWMLVVHRVTATSAEVWVGTLFPTLKMPLHAQVDLLLPDGSKRTHHIVKADWQRPFRKVNQRFYVLCTFDGLLPHTRYHVEFSRRIEAIPGVLPESWQPLRSGCFDTLPARIPDKGAKPFTIGLGSCFYNHRDGGQAAAAYKALYERGADEVRPDVTFLTGDQVYLDIGFDSLSLLNGEIRQRIADDYALHWQALGSILGCGGTWMLPDDHEYWNDYPFYDGLIPALLSLKIARVRSTWTASASDAVKNIQRSPVVEIFSVGQDLSVCLADLRSHRSKHQFITQDGFAQLLSWARGLCSPGVLVIPQLLIDEEDKHERNLLSFTKQYRELLQALAHTGNDIVVLSGDVHFGRIATVKLGNNGGRLIEVVSSPMSNLTGLNGVATSAARSSPDFFPDPRMIRIPEWVPAKVRYDKSFQVKTKPGFLFSAYPKERTREHFMTVSFSRLPTGEIELSVNAWRIRERCSPDNLPVSDFDQPFKTILRKV
jgi:hypothetical protein